jgi:hypothetical protein
MFDINKPEHPYESLHIWLPVDIRDNKFSIPWLDEWDMNKFKIRR